MSGSQKFIARNRAPRVQIEYDVELYGAQKKVQLPFVMGVLSDLAGKSEQPPVADRKFLEIDADNFDERMRSMAPRASFTVPNTLAGEGNLAVDLTFERMEDFSPQAIAAKVDALAPLLEARRQLADLMAYMDGKSRAEALIENLLTAPDLLRAVVGGTEDTADMDAALASLKARMPESEPEDDGADRTLAELAARAPGDAPLGPSADDILGGIERREAAVEEDRTDDVLAGIERRKEIEAADRTDEVLGEIERRGDSVDKDETGDILAGIERKEEDAEADMAADVLAAIERREAAVQDDRTDDVLASIDRREAAPQTDDTADVLAGIDRHVELPERDEAADVLAGLERRDTPAETDRTADVLAEIERHAEVEDTDESADVLAGIQRRAEASPEDGTEDVLAGIERLDDAEKSDETTDVLAGIERSEEVAQVDDTSDVLASIERRDDVVEDDTSDDILASLQPVASETAKADDLDDILAGLEPAKDAPAVADNSDDVFEGLKDSAPVDEAPDRTDDILGALEPSSSERDEVRTEDVRASSEHAEETEPNEPMQDRAPADLDAGDDSATDGTGSDVPPSDLEVAENDTGGTVDASEADGLDDLDALLADLGGGEKPGETGAAARETEPAVSVGDAAENDLDAVLANLDGPGVPAPTDKADAGADAAQDDLDALLAGLGEAEDTAASDVDEPGIGTAQEPDAAADDLDALLADLGASDVGDASGDAQPDLDALPDGTDGDEPDNDAPLDAGLDDLLAELGASDVGEAAAPDELEALLSDLTSDVAPPETAALDAGDELDALLADIGAADLGGDTAEAENDSGTVDMTVVATPKQTPFGTISAPQTEREKMNRNRFRMAIFGDFTGRSARGLMETGDALAARKPILLDVDTVEDVIAGFATTLTLPLGKDGEGIEVKLGGLDDLHPDELYENVEIFDAISGLRQQLGVGSMAGKTTERLKEWAQEFGTPVRLPKRSASTSVPPDLKLSDFQALIGDTRGALTRATPADDLIARIVGPHVVKAPDAGAAEMLEAVDEALSAAMRLVLHHPDFQAVESQWRSLDLLARRIETDSDLQIVLFDVSAEEMAVDLSAHEDLAQSGLYRLLTDVMDPEEGDGGFSALFGLYTFEETPPHAELLARIGLVASHVDAPFFAAITPSYLEIPKEDRHKLVAEAWDTLRAQPQAAWLGLASPRFLLRQPYGAKSDPIYEFEFEEFTPKEGLKGLLWANPVVLVAILLAATYKKDGRSMNLGSLMSLGELPFTYVKDRYGDQVALPCTERNLTSDPAQATLARGYMPVLWVKGRNEIRLGSFRSLAGSEIAGPWSSEAPPRPAPPQATLAMDIKADGASDSGETAAAAAPDDPLADLDALLDSGDNAESGDGLDLLGSGDDDGQSLDDLLASFADEGDGAGDDDDMDPELAALLEGL